MVQTSACMVLMILNSLLWSRRSKFSATWHTIHYFVAAALLIAYIPRKDLAPVMMGPKFAYTNMNMFLFQCILGMIAGLTHTHQFIALLVTMIYQVIYVKIWFDTKLQPICVWDGYIHMIWPIFLMLALGYIGTKERIKKDEKIQNEFNDVK